MSIILPNGNGFWRKGFLGNDGNTTKGESCFGNRKSSRSLLNTHNLDTVVSERGMFSICRNIFSIISPSDPAAHPVFCQVFYFWREKTFLGLLFHFISFWSTGSCWFCLIFLPQLVFLLQGANISEIANNPNNNNTKTLNLAKLLSGENPQCIAMRR